MTKTSLIEKIIRWLHLSSTYTTSCDSRSLTETQEIMLVFYLYYDNINILLLHIKIIFNLFNIHFHLTTQLHRLSRL